MRDLTTSQAHGLRTRPGIRQIQRTLPMSEYIPKRRFHTLNHLMK